MYFCIPTINCEINGTPILIEDYADVIDLDGEWTVYFIKLYNYIIKEI